MVIDFICNETSPYQSWQTYSITPDVKGNPKPFVWTYNVRAPLALSVVGLDNRDTVLNIYIDRSFIGSTSDIVVDTSISCGEDPLRCVSMGMTQGKVILPQGKHTISVTWAGKSTLLLSFVFHTISD